MLDGYNSSISSNRILNINIAPTNSIYMQVKRAARKEKIDAVAVQAVKHIMLHGYTRAAKSIELHSLSNELYELRNHTIFNNLIRTYKRNRRMRL